MKVANALAGHLEPRHWRTLPIPPAAVPRPKPVVMGGFWHGVLGLTIAALAADTVSEATEDEPEAAPTYVEDAGPEHLKLRNRVSVITNAAAAAVAAIDKKASKRLEWHASWKEWDGLHVALERKTLLGQEVKGVTNIHVVHLAETRMAGKLGAKFALDGAAYVTDDDFTGFDPGAELRRARIYTKGDCLFLIPVSYELEIGYVPGSFYLENSYLEFHNLGLLDFLGTLKLGQYQVPMSLVNYGSSRDMVFMESAAPLAALAPGVNAGVQVGRPVFNEHMTWALGLFTDSVGDDFGDATKGFGRVVGRVTGLSFYNSDADSPHSQRLLHLGVGGTALYAGEESVRYRSRPESHSAPYVVDTGPIAANASVATDFEVAWVNGPLCLQGEYLHSWVQGESADATGFGGFYTSASWFLTAESRAYNRKNGTFGRVIPKRNFNFGKGGCGAWELAGRYSFVSLNSGDIEGGRLSMFMAGVNWYLHSHLIWRFNYGFGHVSGRTPDGNLNIFETRLELDF